MKSPSSEIFCTWRDKALSNLPGLLSCSEQWVELGDLERSPSIQILWYILVKMTVANSTAVYSQGCSDLIKRVWMKQSMSVWVHNNPQVHLQICKMLYLGEELPLVSSMKDLDYCNWQYRGHHLQIWISRVTNIHRNLWQDNIMLLFQKKKIKKSDFFQIKRHSITWVRANSCQNTCSLFE